MKLTPEQHELWKLIDKQISNDPDSLYMNTWHSFPPVTGLQPWGLDDLTEHCGTTACVAGWAVLLSGKKIKGGTSRVDGTHERIEACAQAALGLTDGQADLLFNTSGDRAREIVKNVAEKGRVPRVL